MDSLEKVGTSNQKVILKITCDLESIVILQNKRDDIIEILNGIENKGPVEMLAKNLISKLHVGSSSFSIGHNENNYFCATCPVFISFDELEVEISSCDFNGILNVQDIISRSVFLDWHNIAENSYDKAISIGSKIQDSGTIIFSIETDGFDVNRLKFLFFDEDSVEDYRLLGIEYDGIPVLGCFDLSKIHSKPSIDTIELSEVTIYSHNLNFSLTDATETGVSKFSEALDIRANNKNDEDYLIFCPHNILEVLGSETDENVVRLLTHIYKSKPLSSWEKIFEKKIKVERKKKIYDDGCYSEWTEILVENSGKPSWIDDVIDIECRGVSNYLNYKCHFYVANADFKDEKDQTKRHTRNLSLIYALVYDYSLNLDEFPLDDSAKDYFSLKHCLKNEDTKGVVQSLRYLFKKVNGEPKELDPSCIARYSEDMTEFILNDVTDLMLSSTLFFWRSDVILYSGSSCIPKIIKHQLQRNMGFLAHEMVKKCVLLREKLIAKKNEFSTGEVDWMEQSRLQYDIERLDFIFEMRGCFPVKINEIAKDRDTFDSYHKFFLFLDRNKLIINDRILVERIADAAVRFDLLEAAKIYYRYSLKVASHEGQLNVTKKLKKKLAKIDHITIDMDRHDNN